MSTEELHAEYGRLVFEMEVLQAKLTNVKQELVARYNQHDALPESDNPETPAV